MKNFVVLFVAIIALASKSAFAQRSVSMYGLIDTMIRHTTHEMGRDNTVSSKTRLTQGLFQGSRIGFKGLEALDKSNSAVFQIEMGFNPETGASDQQGQLDGRQVFVGLKNKVWGEIDLGRQYGVAFDVLSNYDPLGMGNSPENAWQLFLLGVRFDNTLKYIHNFGPFTTEVQYSFGEGTVANSPGSTTGFGLAYHPGIFSIGFVHQHSIDANSHKMNVAGLGTTFNLKPVTLMMNYINTRRDAGFAIGESNSSAPLANTTLLGNANNTLQRTDNVLTAGLIYQATAAMAITFSYMTDSVKNGNSSGDSGKISTVYAIADYSVSKHTDIYAGMDYTKVSGSEMDKGSLTNTLLQFSGAGLGGASTRTGIAIGLRTKF